MEITIDRIDKARASRIRMMRDAGPVNATEVFCLVSGSAYWPAYANGGCDIKQFTDLHACVWFYSHPDGSVAQIKMCFDQERDIAGDQPVHEPDISDEVEAELRQLAASLEGKRCG